MLHFLLRPKTGKFDGNGLKFKLIAAIPDKILKTTLFPSHDNAFFKRGKIKRCHLISKLLKLISTYSNPVTFAGLCFEI